MAGPFKVYNIVNLRLTQGALNLSCTNSGKFKMLLLNGYTPARTHNFVSQVIAASTAETNNLTSNRVALTNVTMNTTNAAAPLWRASNLSFVASGGNATATYAAIYDDESGTLDSNKYVVCYGELGGTQTITNGSTIIIDLSNGILSVSDANQTTP